MRTSIRAVRLNHMNLVVEDHDASVAHFRDLYGADLLAEFPQKEWRACLMDIGGGILELFAPYDFLLNARYGPHHLGVEYQADMGEVRQAVASHGLRIVRDIGLALHTHPADCFGVAFEFYDGSFHDREWPNLGGPMKPATWWREEHPLGLSGLKGYSLAVHDLQAASRFLQSFLSAETLGEDARPEISAQARSLAVADAMIEVLAPVGDGALEQHLRRFGEGVRSTIFGVRSLDQARRYFAERGVELTPGAAPDRLAVPAELNRGVVFEFAE